MITTENADWATDCPEYKVTAVQVARVMQPSSWQQDHQRWDQAQQRLFAQGLAAAEVSGQTLAPARVRSGADAMGEP